MKEINLHELIDILPDLINLFLSGFIFMRTYTWLNNIEHDSSIMTIWSLFISFLLKSCYSVIHGFILKDIIFNDYFKALIYSGSGFILAVIITYLKNTDFSHNIFRKLNHKTLHNDIWDDVIDYDKRTTLAVYLKSVNYFYIGSFVLREEKGIDSYIALIDYVKVDKDTNGKVFDSDWGNIKTSVVINLNDIESIEIFYDDNSEVWKRIGTKISNADVDILSNNSNLNVPDEEKI